MNVHLIDRFRFSKVYWDNWIAQTEVDEAESEPPEALQKFGIPNSGCIGHNGFRIGSVIMGGCEGGKGMTLEFCSCPCVSHCTK